MPPRLPVYPSGEIRVPSLKEPGAVSYDKSLIDSNRAPACASRIGKGYSAEASLRAEKLDQGAVRRNVHKRIDENRAGLSAWRGNSAECFLARREVGANVKAGSMRRS